MYIYRTNMPGKKTSYKRRTTTKKNKSSPTSDQVKRIVRAEIRREDKKDHPLQWYDVLFTGEYIKTAPTLFSVDASIVNEIDAADSYTNWPLRTQHTIGDYHQANAYITGINWQLRFQQNAEATNDVTTDTVRVVFYSHDDTYLEANNPIFDGADIDQPPMTDHVRSMYFDRILTLTAGYTEGEADDTQFVPGQRIIKGFKKLNHKLMLQENNDSVAVMEGGDIRLEMQSDDDSTIGHVQVYGFLRVYYRIMD